MLIFVIEISPRTPHKGVSMVDLQGKNHNLYTFM